MRKKSICTALKTVHFFGVDFCPIVAATKCARFIHCFLLEGCYCYYSGCTEAPPNVGPFGALAHPRFFSFPELSPLLCVSLTVVLLGYGGMAFARHDVSLKFGIKDCFILERMVSTTTSFAMTICFVSSHIISSAAYPKYVWVQWDCFKRRGITLLAINFFQVPSLILLFPELPPRA